MQEVGSSKAFKTTLKTQFTHISLTLK